MNDVELAGRSCDEYVDVEYDNRDADLTMFGLVDSRVQVFSVYFLPGDE
jgi:hypothetical protein